MSQPSDDDERSPTPEDNRSGSRRERRTRQPEPPRPQRPHNPVPPRILQMLQMNERRRAEQEQERQQQPPPQPQPQPVIDSRPAERPQEPAQPVRDERAAPRREGPPLAAPATRQPPPEFPGAQEILDNFIMRQAGGRRPAVPQQRRPPAPQAPPPPRVQQMLRHAQPPPPQPAPAEDRVPQAPAQQQPQPQPAPAAPPAQAAPPPRVQQMLQQARPNRGPTIAQINELNRNSWYLPNGQPRRARAWVFTSWDNQAPSRNYANGQLRQLRLRGNGGIVTIDGLRYQQERSTAQDGLHRQGYVEFSGKVTGPQALALLGLTNTHIEPRGGTQQQAMDYVWKDETAVPNTRVQEGQFHAPGVNNQWAALRQAMDAGDVNNIGDAAQDERFFRMAMQYASGLEKVANTFRNTKRVREVTTWLFYGPTGTGKTHRVYELTGGDVHHKMPGSPKFWEGLENQPNLLLDEFTGKEHDFPIALLLRVLDKWPLTVEVKGSSRPAPWNTVYITTNIPFDRWYPDASPEHKEALARRLPQDHRIEMKDRYVPPPLPVPTRQPEDDEFEVTQAPPAIEEEDAGEVVAEQQERVPVGPDMREYKNNREHESEVQQLKQENARFMKLLEELGHHHTRPEDRII